MLTWLYAFIEAKRGQPCGADTTAMIGGAITVGGFAGGMLCGYVSVGKVVIMTHAACYHLLEPQPYPQPQPRVPGLCLCGRAHPSDIAVHGVHGGLYDPAIHGSVCLGVRPDPDAFGIPTDGVYAWQL